MDIKELKKLNRKELLEILLEQAKVIEKLENDLDETKEELRTRKITIAESGSIAEATLKLSKIFEHAQKVADDYVNTVIENNKKYELNVFDGVQKELDYIEKNNPKLSKAIKKSRRRKASCSR